MSAFVVVIFNHGVARINNDAAEVFASIFVIIKAKPRFWKGVYIRYVTDWKRGFNEEYREKAPQKR